MAIEPAGNRYLVRTDRLHYRCEQVVVTAGAWNSQILEFLRPRLVVRRKHQYWFEMPDPRMQLQGGSPCYFFETASGYYYGFPVIEGGLGKIARHSGGEPVPDPTRVDRSMDLEDLQRVRQFARDHLRLDLAQPVRHAVCMYTMSPDEHFVVDVHPEMPGVALVAGLSGHGFKFAPVLGDYAVRLARGERDPRFDFLRYRRLDS
jgi:glycine/D-amino acid oxidase-like deaminating enzyme